MTVSVTDQALFFAGALVMGAAVGLLYDAFRILRVRVRLPLLGGVLDLLFWLVVTVALFVYTTTAGSGEVRLYIVAAVLLGAAAYFWLLSRWFLKLGYRLADLVGVLWRVLTLPVVFLLRLCKKIGKTAKKSFHYRRKCICRSCPAFSSFSDSCPTVSSRFCSAKSCSFQLVWR